MSVSRTIFVGLAALLATASVSGTATAADPRASAAAVVQMIEGVLHGCKSFDYLDEKAMLATRPQFRGLAVVDIVALASDEGELWGVVFDGDVKTVAKAIPEASKKKKVRTKDHETPVDLGLDPGTTPGQTFLFCRWKNPNPMD